MEIEQPKKEASGALLQENKEKYCTVPVIVPDTGPQDTFVRE